MAPPERTLAVRVRPGAVKILPPESTDATTASAATERMSMVPPCSTLAAISGRAANAPATCTAPPFR
jgi:hypothetical protein